MRKVLIIINCFLFAITNIAQTIIIAPTFTEARGFSEGLAAVKQDKGWGFIDISGNIVIPLVYNDVRDFHEGKAAVKTEKGWGYINANNIMVIPDKFYDARDFSEGLAAVKSTIDTTKTNWDGYNGEYYGHRDIADKLASWQYIKEDGTLAFLDKFRDISTFHDGMACVFNYDYWYFINKEGKTVYKTMYDNYYPVHYADGLIPNIGGDFDDEWGYTDLTGKWIIQPQYRSVTEFCDGIAVVEEFGGKKKVINNLGEVLYTGENNELVVLKGGYIHDGTKLYYLNNISEPYTTIEIDVYGDIVTIPSPQPWPNTLSYNMEVPDLGQKKIISIEILRSLKTTYYKQPYKGIWATEYDNGLWGYTALNLQDFINQQVESQVAEWEKKGEFESMQAYRERTSQEKRHQVMTTLADNLMNNLLKKEYCQWELSKYDAEHETFDLTTEIGKYIIKIPPKSAKLLRDNWEKTKKHVNFIYNNGLTLGNIDFSFPQGSKETTLSVNTATGTIFENRQDVINKELPTINWLDFLATVTEKECPIRIGVSSKSKIESVSITLNGNPDPDRGIKTVNSGEYDMTINRTLTLNEGANVIKVCVRNVAGTTQEEKTIVYRQQEGELPTIDWLDFAATANKKDYQMKLGIKSKSKIEEVNVSVNGNVSRGIKPVNVDGFDMTIDRIISLSEGLNRIIVSVRNGEGIATSEKVITYKGSGTIFNDKRIALIIGNSHYSKAENNLANPENDAKDMAEKLKGLGFEVMLKLDASLKDMRTKLSEFKNKAKDYDVALFYYAGHGIQSKGANYLIPSDINGLNDEEDLEYNCENMQHVLDVMDASSCKLKIVILDACRDNPLARSWHRSGGSRGLSLIQPPSGTLISFSTSPGKTASDGSGLRNSPYTAALLQTLDIPNLELLPLFKTVNAEVKKRTKQAQNPWFLSDFSGDFYFNNQ